jgi:CheY-like chemotaxis protein
MERLLGRVLREDIELVSRLAPALGQVRADPAQLEQVILNLAINGRDAMPDGGRLVIETRETELDGRSGRFAMLSITDSGVGMDKATRERIFDPFFTTKEMGKGTGLGLSTVYGIVQQSNGHITVESEPGLGTTIAVALPVVASGEAQKAARVSDAEALGELQGLGTVLLVEDDDDVRVTVRRALASKGFRVCEAAHGEEAIAVANGEKSIDLVLTGMVLPGSSGPAIFDCVRVIHPEAQVLYMSGHADPSLPENAPEASAFFLQKPFTPQLLLRKIRDVLGVPT